MDGFARLSGTSGVKWAVAIAVATYLAQALALLLWLAMAQAGGKPLPQGDLESAARWIPVYAGGAAMFLSGVALGRFKPLEEAFNIALLSAGLFLALDIALAMALVPQLKSWNWAAYSFLSKALVVYLGVWIAGGGSSRR